MAQVEEIPQNPILFSRPPPVSVFQGYNPQTMQQVEGPYQGGWAPLMQDPVTYAAMGPTMGLGQMFSQAAYQGLPQMVPQRAMPQPSAMYGYEPPTTRPGMVYNRGIPTPAMPKAYVNPRGRAESGYYSPEMAEHDLPTFYEWAQSSDPGKRQFAENAIRQIQAEQASPMVPLRGSPTTWASSRQNPEWAGRVDVTDPRTTFAPGGFDPLNKMGMSASPTSPIGYEHGTQHYGEDYETPVPRQTGKLPQNIQWHGPPEPTKIPISTYQGKMSAPLPPRWGSEFEDWMVQHAPPEGKTVSGRLVPIPEQQPLRIKDADNFYMMPAQGYLPAEDATFGRPTRPLESGIQINRAGYGSSAGEFTRPLDIRDLFREFPE